MNHKLNRKKRVRQSLTAALILALAVCGGCAAVNTQEAESSTAEESAQTQQTASTASYEEGVSAYTESYDLEFSNRDMDASYDETDAVYIGLSNSGISVDGQGVEVDGTNITITQEGKYILQGTLENGCVYVDTTSETKVQLVLDGVSISNNAGPAIYVKQADKCFITLAEGTENTLSDGTSYTIVDEDDGDTEPCAALFSKDDLTINGSGSLTVTGNCEHAICSKDDLVITGGTYTISAVEDGLRGRDCVKIADGTFTITTGQDAIKSNNDEDEGRGYVYIQGGNFEISAGDDAVHAETLMSICGGVVNVSKCYEGYEGLIVEVAGGTTHIVASDDAINAASASTSDAGFSGGFMEGGFGVSDSSCLITIHGGYTVLEADGDGVDSNGSVQITDGVLLVSGPTSADDGFFDYDLSAEITGGTVLMVGSAGMAQNFSSGTQGFALTQAQGNAGDSVALVNSSGEVVVSMTAAHSFEMVLASDASITSGDEFTLVIGGSVNGANEDGYANNGTVSGGTSTSVSFSTEATNGMGGLGSNGEGMGAGQPGDIQDLGGGQDPRGAQPDAGFNKGGEGAGRQ